MSIPKSHRRVVLVRRPPGEPAESDFRVEEVPMPEPKHGQVLVKVAYLSLDPYQRGRMREAAGYAANVGLGEVMTGGVVGEVVKSLHPTFKEGDIVEESLGWQEYAIGGGPRMRKVDPSLAPVSTANGVLGMPGMTAYFGLLECGRPKPGETIVVSAASGAVGQIVGQIGKLMGCRVIGIAGGAKKCAFVKDELGFDACLDYKAEKDLDKALLAMCPKGIDVYFDNVGGEISDAVLRNINFFGRVALCGSISQYNATSPPMGPRLLGTFVGKRVSLRGFIVFDFVEHYPTAMRQIGEWIKAGKIKYREDIVEGIDKAPRAFIGMLRGENFGKMLVKMYMGYDAPFAGLKVVDLSQGIAGPYCAMLLAQYGAQVIKVEGIGDGDWARTLGVRHGSHSAFSIIGNMGKRSLAVDLKSAAGKQVVWRLLEGADVFLEGFRPGVIKRLGFDYEAVSAREPRLLYLSISGFGQTGPLAERPAMDPVLQAYTGLMNENRGEDGIPHRVPVIVVDMSTALYAFQALAAALYARRDETRGRYIDVSLMQAATNLQSIRLMANHLEGGTVKPGGAPAGVFKTADGWMSILAMNDRDWKSLCEAMKMPELADDPLFATPVLRQQNDTVLYAIVRPAISALPSAIWSERLTRARLMHERLNSYADFMDQPHVRETGLIQWLQQAGVKEKVPVPTLPGMPPQSDGTPRAIAPVTGQHSAAILAEHGFTPAEISALLSQGTVAQA